VGEGVVGVDEEAEVFGEVLGADEFLGVVFEFGGGAGVDEEEGDVGLVELVGVGAEVGDLFGAVGALSENSKSEARNSKQN